MIAYQLRPWTLGLGQKMHLGLHHLDDILLYTRGVFRGGGGVVRGVPECGAGANDPRAVNHASAAIEGDFE